MAWCMRSSWRSTVLGAAALAVLAGLAPSPVNRTDNFNNNALAAFWADDAVGVIVVSEQNGRLEFNSTGATGALSAAGILFDPYGINWRKDFHIQWNGRLKINNIPAQGRCFMGTLLVVAGEFPATMTALGAGFYRDSNGLWFGALRIEDGAIVSFQGSIVTSTAGGLVEIDWDRSLDRLTAELTPGPSAFQSDFYQAFGPTLGSAPMAIIQGLITFEDDVAVVGSRAYIDNWQATFFKRQFP